MEKGSFNKEKGEQLTVAKSLSFRPRFFFFLLILSCLAIIHAINDFDYVYGASVDSAPVALEIDRSDSYYILDLPSGDGALGFTWDVEVDEVLSGQEAILQFSSDELVWSNLIEVRIIDNEIELTQPIDSTWAVVGKNFLRVVVGSEISNTVELTVHVGIWSWLLACSAGLFAIAIVLFWIRRRISFKRFKWISERKKKVAVISIGLLVLLALAPWTEQRFDNYVNRLWGSAVYEYSFFPFYPSMPVDYPLLLRYAYPPVWLYIILALFPIWLSSSGFAFPANPASLWIQGVEVNNIFESYRSFVPQTLPVIDLLLKLPNIIAGIGIAVIISKLFDDSNQKNTTLVMWIFNPFIICISAVWGLADALCAFLAILSVYLLLRKRNLLSSLLLSLAIATKLYPVFFVIPILIYIYRNQGRTAFFKYLVFSLVFGALIFGSFFIFPGGGKLVYELFFFKASPDMMGENLFAGMTWMNIFSVFSWNGNIPIFPLIFIPSYLGINYLFWKKKNTFDSLIVCLTCTILLSYLSYTVVNPQYILWVLPFLLYLTVKGKYPKKLFIIFSLLPLIFIFSVFNPLYMLSPAVVWNENNYPPISDIIQQVWPTFSGTTIAILIVFFTFITMLSLTILQSQSFYKFTRHLWKKGSSKFMIRYRRLKGKISVFKPK